MTDGLAEVPTAKAAPGAHRPASGSGADADAKVSRGRSFAPRRRERPKRELRRDVEGLRALAVGSVVLFHADVPGVQSGFVGVDIFFVISGFLITGLLVREAEKQHGVSIVRFYARRAKRILPASTLVLVATVLASYHWLGFIAGDVYATDAKWTALFSANLHFGALQTTYLGAQAPPSPFQQMWSLGVEEQFYIVWPLLVLLVTFLARGRANFRAILCTVLAVGALASFLYSIHETSSNPPWGYFSPITRAWELALGGLVAIATPWLVKTPKLVVHLLGTAGLAATIASVFVYDSHTAYPGYAAALPVVGTGVLIAAGSASSQGAVQGLLGWAPFQWIGARSYSLYLWHWPILIIAAQHLDHSLTGLQRLECVTAAVLLAALTYRLVENPIRHARIFVVRPWWSVAMGLVLIAGAVIFAQWQIASHFGTWHFLTGLSAPT